jgi:hypothetical protein
MKWSVRRPLWKKVSYFYTLFYHIFFSWSVRGPLWLWLYGSCTVKLAHVVTSIKQLHVLKGHVFLVLSWKISYCQRLQKSWKHPWISNSEYIHVSNFNYFTFILTCKGYNIGVALSISLSIFVKIVSVQGSLCRIGVINRTPTQPMDSSDSGVKLPSFEKMF